VTVEQSTDNTSGWPLLAELARTVAESDDEHAIWAHADAVFASFIGHRLFTVLGCNEQVGEVIRLYSSRPAEYPVSGTKVMRSTPWGDHVLKQGRHFIGKDAADIEWAFPDHVLIASMGLESIINLPVRAAGTTIGTINLLHVANFYHQDQIEIGTILAALLAPVLIRKRHSWGLS
jgi:GAF domain-containing protein